jgi:DNA-binding NtrC family response regulator
MKHAKEKKTAPQHTILVVDDDLNVLEVIKARLTFAGYKAIKAASALEALDRIEESAVDLIVSDIKMPGMNGLELFEKVHATHPALPVIFLTAHGTIPDAIKAVKAGAYDYLTKPFDGHELLDKIKEVIHRKPPALSTTGSPLPSQSLYTGKSPVMTQLYSVIARVAQSHVNILLLGESGVGKEHVAKLVHAHSSRSNGPFIVVDCGATPPGLLESELFGHKRGAFTHAVNDKKGLIEASDNGTLFLDEIGNISSEMQMRLLRFLEDRKIRRVGSLRQIPVNCRIIAATNSDLTADIEEGRFREDLYYRLRVVSLDVPRLQDRREDIPVLAHHFAEHHARVHGIDMVEILSETMDWLCDYPWPGNVRELKNALEAGIVLCQDGKLRVRDLQLTGLPQNPNRISTEKEPYSLESNEENAIIRALEKTGGVQKAAADLLGISRRAIHYKVKKFGIDVAAIRSRK